MNRLQQRLFEHYDRSYLRGNALEPDAVGPAVAERYVREYEAEFGALADQFPTGAPVADLGCGIGLLLYWLAKTRAGRCPLVGVELSERQLALASRTVGPEAELVHCDAVAYLRSTAKRFGGIFCTDVLEHVESDDDLLQLVELARGVLVPGGVFVCRVPNMANLSGSHLRYIDITHCRGFTAASLIQLLEAAGFARCWIEPRRAADRSQWLRLGVEHLLHRALFRICGVGDERHFGRTIVGVGRG